MLALDHQAAWQDRSQMVVKFLALDHQVAQQHHSQMLLALDHQDAEQHHSQMLLALDAVFDFDPQGSTVPRATWEFSAQ